MSTAKTGGMDGLEMRFLLTCAVIITYKQRVHDLVSIYPLTAQPRVSYWTVACIIVATITGLMLLIAALFCGILVAGL